jgi:hypothetical protein
MTDIESKIISAFDEIRAEFTNLKTDQSVIDAFISKCGEGTSKELIEAVVECAIFYYSNGEAFLETIIVENLVDRHIRDLEWLHENRQLCALV